MTLLQQALSIMGNRESMTSGELLYRLDPNYLQTYTTKQQAGFHLSKALGVRPHHFFDSTKERWRSEYHRADLEAKLGERLPRLAVVPEPASPAPAPPTSAVGDGITRCGQCGASNPWEDEPCWRCKEPLQGSPGGAGPGV